MSERSSVVRAADGAGLFYRVTERAPGAAPTLLLLHGAASNHTRWSEFVEGTELAATWRIVRPDLRGNGESLWRGRLTLERWADDVAAILEAEAIERTIVCGHSLGAQIAVVFAHRHAERTTGLVLIDPVYRRALKGRMRSMARFRGLVAAAALAVRAVNRLGMHRRFIPNRDLRQLDEETRREIARVGLEELVARYGSFRLAVRYMPTAVYLQQMVELMRPLPPLEAIAVPALAVVSTGLGFSDHDGVLSELKRLPSADVVEIDATHWPLTERPTEVRRAIDRWCRRFENRNA